MERCSKWLTRGRLNNTEQICSELISKYLLEETHRLVFLHKNGPSKDRLRFQETLVPAGFVARHPVYGYSDSVTATTTAQQTMFSLVLRNMLGKTFIAKCAPIVN